MANHKSSKKMIRKIERRTAINKRRKTIVKTAVKKAEIALGIRGNNPKAEKIEVINPLLIEAEKKLMRGAQKNIISKKAASRKVSRLNKKLKALSA